MLHIHSKALRSTLIRLNLASSDDDVADDVALQKIPLLEIWITRINRSVTAIKAAKRKEHVRDLEEAILKEIQDKYSKVQAQAPEEEGEEANEERAKINELLADSKEIRGGEEDFEEGEASDVDDLEDNFELAKKKKKE